MRHIYGEEQTQPASVQEPLHVAGHVRWSQRLPDHPGKHAQTPGAATTPPPTLLLLLLLVAERTTHKPLAQLWAQMG